MAGLAAAEDGRRLRIAAARLSEDYRDRSLTDSSGSGRLRQRLAVPIADRTTAVAYAATRLPATYAAMRSALQAATDQIPPGRTFRPVSQLDLGTGSGAALLAAGSLWPSLGADEAAGRRSRLGIDESSSMLEVAGRLVGPGARLERGEVRQALESLPSGQSFDVVTLGYVLGELDPDEAAAVVALAWARTAGVVAVVEAGTPLGFSAVRAARDVLRAPGAGASLLAPCPHAGPCPIEEPDWCHFAARIERSPLHRRLKGGELGYEDEKFSYVVAARPAVAGDESERGPVDRVLRHPWRAPRRVDVTLCTPSGIRTERVGRSDARYREWSRAGWGAALPTRGSRAAPAGSAGRGAGS